MQAHQESRDPDRQKKSEDSTVAWVSYLNRDQGPELANHSITGRNDPETKIDISTEQVPSSDRAATAHTLQLAIRTEVRVEPEVKRPAEVKIVSPDQVENKFQSTGFFNWLFGKAQDGFFSGICYYGVVGQLALGAFRSWPGGESPWSHFVTAAIFGIGLFVSWNHFRQKQQIAQIRGRLESSDGD